MRPRLITAIAITALTAGLGSAVTTAEPAAADVAQQRVVSENPVDFTPHVLDGTVRAIALVGTAVVVGGDFSVVTDASGSLRYRRHHLFAYDLGTGRVLDFAPEVNGPVYALAPGAGNTVYAGGDFWWVNGVAQRGVAQISLDGSRVPGFTATINYGDVRSLVAAGSWLYAAGTFTRIGGANRAGLARLSPVTGAADTGFDLRLAAPNLSRVKVEDIAVSPNGLKLAAIGAIQRAGGLNRAQIVLADLTTGQVADWYTDAYRGPCMRGFDTYLRGVDFSPDSSYLAVVGTGRLSGPTRMCDTVARFDVAGTGPHAPVWVNRTGGDSLYAVSITGSAVYVGGHQRWMDNPYGHESAGRGAVRRTGIAAVDPVTGRAMAWNPTRARGIGVRALVAWSGGLLVGSDTETLGHEYHGRIGMFPPA